MMSFAQIGTAYSSMIYIPLIKSMHAVYTNHPKYRKPILIGTPQKRPFIYPPETPCNAMLCKPSNPKKQISKYTKEKVFHKTKSNRRPTQSLLGRLGRPPDLKRPSRGGPARLLRDGARRPAHLESATATARGSRRLGSRQLRPDADPRAQAPQAFLSVRRRRISRGRPVVLVRAFVGGRLSVVEVGFAERVVTPSWRQGRPGEGQGKLRRVDQRPV